jgi:hypothetical protein
MKLNCRTACKIWFTQGLDVRLVDIEIAKRLYEIRNHRMFSFAWDNIKDERVIKQKIELLRQVGFTNNMLRARVQFYVYVDSDEQYDSGVYRCRELKKLNCNAYVMFNTDNELHKELRIYSGGVLESSCFGFTILTNTRKIRALQARMLPVDGYIIQHKLVF